MNALKVQIIEELKNLQFCKPSANNIQWTVRCPYCGDSNRINHGHFSIKVNVDDDEPIVYRCFRCNESGLFTSQTMEDLHIDTIDLYKSIDKFNSKIPKKKKNENRIKEFQVPVSPINRITQNKLNYINNRLGITLDNYTCTDYNIILSLSAFLAINKLDKVDESFGLNIKDNTLKELDRNYIGFLSTDKNKIIFRDISNHGFFGRYYKLTIDSYFDSKCSFYSVNNRFDLLYNDEINVCVSEGTFDIISVIFSMEHKLETKNTLFFASTGFNFITILRYIIPMGVVTNLHLHIYADNDKSDTEIMSSISKGDILLWVDKITVHRNLYENEKDFGVSSDRIIESSYRLK